MGTAQRFHHSWQKCKNSPKMERSVSNHKFKGVAQSFDSLAWWKENKIGKHRECQALSSNTRKTVVQFGKTGKRRKFWREWDWDGDREDTSRSFWRARSQRKILIKLSFHQALTLFSKGGSEWKLIKNFSIWSNPQDKLPEANQEEILKPTKEGNLQSCCSCRDKEQYQRQTWS